jgi:predicted Rdx family selenoprotein
MQFHILYCRPCGYRDRADELAAELRSRFGAEVVVEEGKFGQFDVLLDGDAHRIEGRLLEAKAFHGAPPQAKILDAIDRPSPIARETSARFHPLAIPDDE